MEITEMDLFILYGQCDNEMYVHLNLMKEGNIVLIP